MLKREKLILKFCKKNFKKTAKNCKKKGDSYIICQFNYHLCYTNIIN